MTLFSERKQICEQRGKCGNTVGLDKIGRIELI
jgi:hypothetical protein